MIGGHRQYIARSTRGQESLGNRLGVRNSQGDTYIRNPSHPPGTPRRCPAGLIGPMPSSVFVRRWCRFVRCERCKLDRNHPPGRRDVGSSKLVRPGRGARTASRWWIPEGAEESFSTASSASCYLSPPRTILARRSSDRS